MNQINEIIRIVAASLLMVVCIFLIKHSKRGRHTWTGTGFTLSILCYVIIESEVIQSLPILKFIFMMGAICVPVQFWFLSRAIFDDHFRFSPRMAGWFMLQVTPLFSLVIWDLPGIEDVVKIIARIVSLGFVFAGLFVAFQTKRGDLVDSRLRFRNVFISATALIIVMTLIVEAVRLTTELIVVLQLLQRFSIFAITLYFLISNFEIRTGFFFKEIPKPKAQSFDDPLLHSKLQTLLEEKKIYKKEGLTIRELAELLNEQEYRVRRLINGQLGFRNFNDFLNQYRINDACEILSDPGQVRKTILEISYELGYQSIGPFNKAFKELKGITPTAYRKNQITS